jgi:undecaprenyl-phosphate 4-deoxy-4-formamido-L-arabinose transferase
MSTPSVAVVIPVYNSESSLPILLERLHAVLASRGAPFEAVLVNDGSRDRSWAIIQDLASRLSWVRGINLMRNFGQHNALLCGIRSVRHDIVVTMDDDLQHPPEEIPRLLAALDDRVDVVYGTPQDEQHGLFRDVASRVTKWAWQKAMGAATAQCLSAFRAFRTDLRAAFADYRHPVVSIDVLLTWATSRFTSVVVRHEPRRLGQSNYTLAKLIRHAVNVTTSFSTTPLQWASYVGFGMTVFGFLVLAYVLGRYVVQGSNVPGFPFLASIIALFAGTQMMSIGIIGEYLARMHFRLMERPTYVVRQTAENKACDTYRAAA